LNARRGAEQAFLGNSYLDEYAFRYNRRDVPVTMFKLSLGQVSESGRCSCPPCEVVEVGTREGPRIGFLFLSDFGFMT